MVLLFLDVQPTWQHLPIFLVQIKWQFQMKSMEHHLSPSGHQAQILADSSQEVVNLEPHIAPCEIVDVSTLFPSDSLHLDELPQATQPHTIQKWCF